MNSEEIDMTLRLKTRTDVEDLTVGCTFFGTGGGGSLQLGLDMLYPHVDAGKTIEIIDAKRIGDKDWVACAYYSGTIAPPTPEIEELRTRFPWDSYEMELALGLKALEEHMGVKFKAVAPFELGGVNTPAPIDAAMKHGIPCVDGDYSGRAVPEICQNTVCVKGFSMAPLVLIDWYGNKTFVERIINYEMGERISKALSEVAWGRVGNVAFPVRGEDYKNVIIPGTLAKAYGVGRIIRECGETGDDPAERIVEKYGGWVLFRGEVVKKQWENREGYMWGDTTIRGSGSKPGSELKVWFKNENHMTWLDGEPWVMSPDIIEIISQKSGAPITNTDIKKGDLVSVIGMEAAHPMFRTPEGLAVLGPRHFGFNIDYQKIENHLS
ncbi:MAG: DUF917 domain-containing protein [Candidatus Thorarchaeota archaeon]|nr:DUF917 domain-containing protein [Candidatus Thorarchaeota archaeon]